MAEIYTLAETAWPGAAYYHPDFLSGRPDLTQSLAELQTASPFYSTPEYLTYRQQIAGLVSSRNQERQRYEQQANLLADQLRQIEQVIQAPQSFASQLPQDRQEAILKQMQSDFLKANQPGVQRVTDFANYYKNVADTLNTFVSTAKPGEGVSIPRNPLVTSAEQLYGGFILDDPNKPYSYEQRKTFADRGLSVVSKDFIQDYLRSEIIPQQNRWQTYTQQYSDPQFFFENQGQQYQQRIQDELREYQQKFQADKTQEKARLEQEQAQLRNYINPIVSSSLDQEETLRRQLMVLQNAYTAAERAGRFEVPVEQVLQEQAQFEANKQATQQASIEAENQRYQQLLDYVFQSGKIPITEQDVPQELRQQNLGSVAAPPVQAPTVPDYSFLSPGFSFAAPEQPTAPQPAQPVAPQPTATQPVAPQPAQPTATQPVAPTAVTPTTQQPPQLQESSFLGGIPVGVGQAQPTGNLMATTPSLTPESLPPLRSAGGGGTSAIDPTLRPYLELGLRAAEQQFLQTQPQFFPGQTYVSPSQQTLDALAAQEQIARTAPSTLQAAQESYMRGLGGLGATAGGAFLMGNPYQQMAIEAATRPIMQQYQEQTLPGIASGFSAAGRYGSGAMERAQGRAAESTGRAIGDVASNIAYSGYEAERGRQQQAITGQITASQMAPQIYGQQFLPSQQLAQIGAAREAISALPLQEQMARFQFGQQAPAQQLQSFLSSVYGTPMAQSQYAPTPQTQTNRAANVLGLGALGGGIGSMIGGQSGAFGYTTPQLTAGGAFLGALGGLLS